MAFDELRELLFVLGDDDCWWEDDDEEPMPALPLEDELVDAVFLLDD
jgi:hypothetical protein